MEEQLPLPRYVRRSGDNRRIDPEQRQPLPLSAELRRQMWRGIDGTSGSVVRPQRSP